MDHGLQLLFLCFDAGSICSSHGKLGVQMCQPSRGHQDQGEGWICCFQVWGPNWVFNTEICWYAAPSKEFSWIKNKTGTCRFAEKMGPTIAVIRLGSTTLSNWSCNCLRCCRGEALSAIQSARSLAIWLTGFEPVEICIWCAVISETSRYVQGYQPHAGTATRPAESLGDLRGVKTEFVRQCCTILVRLTNQLHSLSTFPTNLLLEAFGSGSNKNFWIATWLCVYTYLYVYI